MHSEPVINMIVAACENGGIGMKGNLPWRLRSELKHFAKLTTSVSDPSKMNAVIMGRKTWLSIPEKLRPLKDRLNIVVSRTCMDIPGAQIASSLEEAILKTRSVQDSKAVETAWIIGGQSLFESATKSSLLHRIYFTRILQNFECDVFFPVAELKRFVRVKDPAVDEEVQVEGDIRYQYEVYESASLEEASQ